MGNIKVNKNTNEKSAQVSMPENTSRIWRDFGVVWKSNLNEFRQLWYEIQVSTAENTFALICPSDAQYKYNY